MPVPPAPGGRRSCRNSDATRCTASRQNRLNELGAGTRSKAGAWIAGVVQPFLVGMRRQTWSGPRDYRGTAQFAARVVRQTHAPHMGRQVPPSGPRQAQEPPPATRCSALAQRLGLLAFGGSSATLWRSEALRRNTPNQKETGRSRPGVAMSSRRHFHQDHAL